jgi:hypothetical protein
VLAGHHDPHDGAAPEAYAARRAAVVGTLLAQGDEVGLHASYTAGEHPARLAAEREALDALAGAPVQGNRFHYLRLRWHQAMRELDALGLDYDSSLGYAERVGPRAGLSFPFRPWDVTGARPLRLLQVPLVLMDATLAERRYLGLAPADGRGVVDRLLDRLAAVGGAAAVLWHNDRFDRLYGRGWGDVYRALVDGVAARGGWAGPAGELAAYWRRERCGS